MLSNIINQGLHKKGWMVICTYQYRLNQTEPATFCNFVALGVFFRGFNFSVYLDITLIYALLKWIFLSSILSNQTYPTIFQRSITFKD